MLRLMLLVLILALATLSCSDDEFESSSDQWKLWIAESISGNVRFMEPSSPVIGAEVIFSGGLSKDATFEFGRGITSAAGFYEIVAADYDNADAGFWRFIVDEEFLRNTTDDVTIFLRLDAGKPGINTTVKEWVIQRRPQKTLPGVSTTFHMVQNILVR